MGQVLVFFNRHSATVSLMKDKQRGPIPKGLKRWPLKLIKHFVDTTCVSPSSTGTAGCRPMNIFSLVNLKFRVSSPNWEMSNLLALLYVMFSCVFVTFRFGVLGWVWYWIVSIPDLCAGRAE